MKYFKSTLFFIAATIFFSCNTIDVYEKTSALPKHVWSSSNRLSFNFASTDSSAYYNFYLVLRHTEFYHFNNVWIDFTLVIPGKKPQTQRLNVLLANGNGWFGSAMDDIIEQRLLLFSHPIKLINGNYTIYVRQVMREDPLENILNAGVRVEKVVQ